MGMVGGDGWLLVLAYVGLMLVGMTLMVWLGHAWGIWDGYRLRIEDEAEERWEREHSREREQRGQHAW